MVNLSDTNIDTYHFFFTDWFGILFLRQGLYQGGTFQFNVIIPENYPDGECPVSEILYC